MESGLEGSKTKLGMTMISHAGVITKRKILDVAGWVMDLDVAKERLRTILGAPVQPSG